MTEATSRVVGMVVICSGIVLFAVPVAAAIWACCVNVAERRRRRLLMKAIFRSPRDRDRLGIEGGE